MNTSASGDSMVRKQISRRDFLKLICAVGGIFMLSTLIPITKVLGINATSNKNISVNGGLNNVGPDGVSFLYPTKPGGFVWFMKQSIHLILILKQVEALHMAN